MELRVAIKEDAGQAWELVHQAREFLKSLGVDQWQGEYPNRRTVEDDIAAGNGYVITDDGQGPAPGQILGYTCISFDGEPCYNTIDGSWKSSQPYAVVHRTAVSNACKGQGLASRILREAEILCLQKGIHSIRIDTDNDNQIMKRVLEKNGYEYCGVIRFDNSDKIAFEKQF